MIKIKEWAVADAQRLQKKADEINNPIWAKHLEAVRLAVKEGRELPEAPELLPAEVPQFHMRGDRIFEVDAKGEGRFEVVDALEAYVANHPKPPKPTPDRGADKSW